MLGEGQELSLSAGEKSCGDARSPVTLRNGPPAQRQGRKPNTGEIQRSHLEGGSWKEEMEIFQRKGTRACKRLRRLPDRERLSDMQSQGR